MKTASSALAVTLLAVTSAAAGDVTLTGVGPQTAVVIGVPQDAYGTGSLTAHQVGSYQFQTKDGSPMGGLAGVGRHLTTGSSATATPMLPAGAQIERVDFLACDNDAAAQVAVALALCDSIGGPCSSAGSMTTGVAATPGCAVFGFTPAVFPIVDNANRVLMILAITGTTVATTFSAVILYYRLRVSPAPAVAAFPNDVPTSHPFFRFVEALAAAGITGGCGAGSYCPDAPVTRGQMAVFLATALGLHFPN